MVSNPSYEPNALRFPGGLAHVARSGSGALVNRATQDGYAPGSTFKVVTATAAIDTGRYTPESTVSGRDGVLISGLPLSNDQHESFGQITLTEGLVHSVNTVYAQVAESLGKRVLGRYMRRFGFNREPQLDYPSTEMSISGEYSGSRRRSRRRARRWTSGAWASARTNSRSPPCRWPRSPPRWPTAGA